MSNLRFHIKPNECALALCIPLSKTEFEADSVNPQKDLIRGSGISWPKYESEIIKPLGKMLPDIQSLGVKIHPGVCFNKFATLFTPPTKLIIFLAHCLDGLYVEFNDGLYQLDQAAASVPTNFVGFLDLIVCNPLSLAQSIVNKNDNNRVRIVNSEASISLWLYYYWYFIRFINETSMDYFDAAKKASRIFDRQILSK